MATPDEARLRLMLGEKIPTDGTEADTLFSDAEITDLLLRNGSVEDSLGEGWNTKAAIFASLVDTIEGSSRRAMSDLHNQALKMVALYEGSNAISPAVTRVHKIVRS